MRADLLAEPVGGLDEALAAVDAFDQALTAGLLRPQPAHADGLVRLARAVAGSPLASPVAEAAAGSADEEHLAMLAAARIALLGAVHDALAAQIREATGRPGGEEHTGGGIGADVGADADADVGGCANEGAGGPHAANLLAAARAWLCDLARAGWRGLDGEVVSGAAQVVSAMLPDPALRRLAMLLDGFAAELAASCPGSALERFPARRWADLWSRGMLLTLPGAPSPPVTAAVTGRLLPLGVDLHEHATAAQAQVHAVFEPAEGAAARLVRASVSVPKPDTVVGVGVWQLLRPSMSLLTAVSEGRSMDLADMPLTAEGDLLWDDDHARPGAPADPFATARIALPAAADVVAAPLDRHPARLAVPVFLEGYAVGQDDGALTFTIAGHPLAVDVGRIPAAGPLTQRAVASSSACIALLRWDAGSFSLQPLAVEATVRKKAVAVHAGGWAGGSTGKDGVKAEKGAADAIAVLRERAGRLLRK